MKATPANVIEFDPARQAYLTKRVREVAKLDGFTDQQLVTAAIIGYLDGDAEQNKYFDAVLDGPLCHREYIEIMKPEKFVDVTLQVPESAVAVFPGPRLAHLPSAGAFDDRGIRDRVARWVSPSEMGGGERMPAISSLHARMVAEGCTCTAGFRFPFDEWKHIERIALQLKVTAGDYLLGHVGYAVWLSKQDRPAPPETLTVKLR